VWKALAVPEVYRRLNAASNVREVYRRLVAGSEYRRGERTLDVGCGPGDLVDFIDPADYVGIDVSEEYVRFARERAPTARFHALPAERVGEVEGSFDLALMVGVFHHLPDEAVRATLAGLERVLKPSGRFVLLEAVWPTHVWDAPGWLIRGLDRGRHVRSRWQWCNLLGEKWFLAKPRISRNRLIEYFECTLLPPS